MFSMAKSRPEDLQALWLYKLSQLCKMDGLTIPKIAVAIKHATDFQDNLKVAKIKG